MFMTSSLNGRLHLVEYIVSYLCIAAMGGQQFRHSQTSCWQVVSNVCLLALKDDKESTSGIDVGVATLGAAREGTGGPATARGAAVVGAVPAAATAKAGSSLSAFTLLMGSSGAMQQGGTSGKDGLRPQATKGQGTGGAGARKVYTYVQCSVVRLNFDSEVDVKSHPHSMTMARNHHMTCPCCECSE